MNKNNKSSNLTANSIDLKANAEKWLKEIHRAGNVYAPENTKLKKEIIDGITNSLDKDILRQVKDAVDKFPCMLLIGNEDKGLLAACYAHCIRDIDYKDIISKYTQPTSSKHYETLPKGHVVKEYINGNSIYHYYNLFDRDLLPPGKGDYPMGWINVRNALGYNLGDLRPGGDVVEWVVWFLSSCTVFLRRLKSGDSDGCREFTRILETARRMLPYITKGPIKSGLFIVHIDSKSDLPDYFIKEFVHIMIDGQASKPLELETAKPSEPLENKEDNKEKTCTVSLLSVSNGTKWSDIEMGVDYYNEKICIKEKDKTQRFGFLKFGLKDARSKSDRMTDLLKILLKYANEENNVIYTSKMQPKEFEKLDADTKRLNKLIRQRIKGIDDPPIIYAKSEGFKSQFGRLYLINTDYDRSREAATSELSDVPDTSLEDNEGFD